MEYVTVLKNPETHIDIGNSVKNVKNEKGCLRRLCSHFDMRNSLIGVLMLIILISILTQLPLYLNKWDQRELVRSQGEQIKELANAKEKIFQLLNEIINTKKTDLAKSRKSRTVSTYTPHFYLTGSERRNSPTDERGIFMWKRPQNRSFSRGNDDFYADINSADNSLKKVTIVRPGVYFVFAKVTANGRKDFETSMVPPVGIYLMKNGAETLDVAWNTQDERGDIYTTNWGYDSDELKYPMDSLSVFGLHMLQVNDQIYIQKPPDRTNNVIDRFLNDGTKASFGAFLVESECSNC